MCAKKRKPKSRRTKQPARSLFPIILVLAIIIIIAAVAAYYFYGIGHPKNNTQPNIPATSKKVISSTKKVSTKSVLDGTWVSTSDGRMLEIHGNSFSMELPSVSEHKVIKGKIYISGNRATIIYTNTKDKCAESPGTYTFVINKASILFSVKHDDCPGRKQIFSTTWEKF
jgi:hypothetical protein